MIVGNAPQRCDNTGKRHLLNKKKKNMEFHIGKLIKQEMKRQGINHRELANRIWVSRTNVYNILERSSIDTELLERICRALHTNFFALIADEVKREVGDAVPAKALEETNMLAFQVSDDDKPFFSEDDLSEGYQEIKRFVLSMTVNGTGFDEVIDLPQDLFPLLVYVYECAMDGPMKGLSEEEEDKKLFAWLMQNHPKLANAIMEAAAEMLTERIAEDTEGNYRPYINYEEPASDDDWYALGDNDIKYFIDDVPGRIVTAKRPRQWLTPSF